MRKYFWCLILTAAAVLLLALCFHTEVKAKEKKEYQLPLSFCVLSKDGEKQVFCWENKQGSIFAFFPSYSETKNTILKLENGTNARLDEIELYDGMTCEAFIPGVSYSLRLGNAEPVPFCFLKSANVATAFIDTASGSMSAVHEDKKYRERANIMILLQNGEPEYLTQSADWIRGHGNATWDLDKKSYNLYLGRKADLFGMGEAKKYVLIANAVDDTNLRNRLVYGFAGEVSPYPGFAPGCEYVDLYLNGEYKGLYLLCEKPENGLNLEPNSELLELTGYHADSGGRSFLLNPGVYVEIHSPDPCTEGKMNQIHTDLSDFQERLLNGEAIPEEIDSDSWARKYLIEEVFENNDSGFFSQFFFQRASDRRYFAGPCWDYDGAIGLYEHFPNCFLAQRAWNSAGQYDPWYSALWQKKEFRTAVIDLYRTEYLPLLNRLLQTEIPEISEEIAQASELNRIRWFDAVEDVSVSVCELESYLRDRVSFLNSAWIDGVEYCTVTLKRSPDSIYLYYCIPKGNTCEELPDPKTVGAEGNTWMMEESGKPFDKYTVITENLTLTAYEPFTE